MYACVFGSSAVCKVVSGIREVRLLGFDPTKNLGKTILMRFPEARTIDRTLNHADWQVVEIGMKSENSEKPTVIDDSMALEWVVVEVNLPSGYRWPRDQDLTRFFSAIVRYKQPNKAAGEVEIDYFVQMVHAMAAALEILFSKNMRNKRRKELIRGIEAQLYEWRNLSPDMICLNTVRAVRS